MSAPDKEQVAGDVGASPVGDRASRPSAQAPAGLGDTATIPSADEAKLLRDIAFSIAMIDMESDSEHDMLLFEDAHERATAWHRRFRENKDAPS